MEFERRKGLEGPMVYSTFQLKTENGEIEEFLIQDLTERFFDEAVKIIIENHAKDAVFHRAAKTLSSESGIRSVSQMYLNVFKEKISLICLKIDTMEIVGINALTYRDSEVFDCKLFSNWCFCINEFVKKIFIFRQRMIPISIS